MKALPFCLVLLAVAVNAQNTGPQLKSININFKNRCYFHASSPQINTTRGAGGWGGSNNYFEKVKPENNFPVSQLAVIIRPEEIIAVGNNYAGISLYVVNTQADTVFFDAQDSRLNMKLQAFHNGEWKDIEYLPNSWCGNSYHMVYLPASTYWKFIMPRYEGKLKTRLRAALGYKDSVRGEERWVYSNEVEGSVNLGQFTKMPKYSPNGIMDPYDN